MPWTAGKGGIPATAARHALVLPPVYEEIYGKALLGLATNITPLI